MSPLRQALLILTLAATVTGCGSIWTYDGALRHSLREQGFSWAPPDSVAFAPPPIPPVYDVVFDQATMTTRDSLESARTELVLRSTRPVVRPDTVFIMIPDTTRALASVETQPPAPDTLRAVPQQVQVDLTPSEEAALISTIESDMKRTSSALGRLEGSKSTSIREQAAAARGLLTQAETAMGQKDYVGAANLARKARLLVENLAANQP